MRSYPYLHGYTQIHDGRGGGLVLIGLRRGRKWEEEKLLARAVLLVSRAYVSVRLSVLAYAQIYFGI